MAVLIDDNILEKSLTGIKGQLDTKVVQVEGKQLSTNDFTTPEKENLASLASDPFGFFSGINALSTAGFHNSIYRGKNLGTKVTDDQWAAIQSGKFTDLFIGDYWAINGTNYVICHFDYYWNCGDTNFNKHHIIVMPAGNMNLNGYYDLTKRLISGPVTIGTTNYGSESASGFRWNAKYTEPADEDSEGTWANYTGLYTQSHMYLDVLPAAEAKIVDAIGDSHLLRCHKLLPSACNANCVATSWAWQKDDALRIDLCNETQVYGQQVWSGTTGYEVGIDKWQFAIFRLNPAFANIRASWWLRSVASATWACSVSRDGGADHYSSCWCHGVRPLAIWGA